MKIWKRAFPAGATVSAEALRWAQDCFVGERSSSVAQVGEQLKEVRKVGGYHRGNLGPERPKELYSVM